jgi:hypothetical protein
LENWWYNMEIRNHLMSNLLISFLSHLWIGSFQNFE